MANKLNKLVVVDVESTCWEKDVGQPNEIIEIGICVLNLKTLDIEDCEGILVKPEYSSVSPFCTQLTTLTQEMVDTGTSFQERCEYLKQTYGTKKFTWASWGDYDRRQFQRQCDDERYNAQYPFGVTHLNAKNLFALQRGLSREVGMAKALEMLNIELEGTHHRGVDDARNIAKIIKQLIKR